MSLFTVTRETPMIRNLRKKTLLAAAMLVAAASLAGACNYHGESLGVFDGNFRALYPKSSVVYFAIMDAVDQGLLERSAFEPAASGGYWNAVARLDEIARRLQAASTPGGPAMSLVFIESDLWARYESGPQGYAVTVHTPGPRAGDVMVVTSEAGVAAMLDGRMPVTVALERGLIALDGEDAARDAVERLLVAAFEARQPASAGARNAPVRLFGPPR
jgi:hypothetical protein